MEACSCGIIKAIINFVGIILFYFYFEISMANFSLHRATFSFKNAPGSSLLTA